MKFILSLIPLVAGLIAIAATVAFTNRYYQRKLRRMAYVGTHFDPPKLYVTCGYCGQSVPASNGFTCDPHKYTIEIEEGKIRVDCPQGQA